MWQLYNTTGDREQLASVYPVVKNIADYVNRAIDHEDRARHKLPGGGGDYQYGIVDWPPNMRYGYDMATVARTTENILASTCSSGLPISPMRSTARGARNGSSAPEPPV